MQGICLLRESVLTVVIVLQTRVIVREIVILVRCLLSRVVSHGRLPQIGALFVAILVLFLDLEDLEEALVRFILAVQDRVAVLLHIWLVLLVELAIVACALIEVTRLANQHRAEIVTDEELASVELCKSGICEQAHPAHEFHEV